MAGIFFGTRFALHRARMAIIEQKPSALSEALGFLHRDLKPHFYWWEQMEMVRRLVLIGFLGVVQPGSVNVHPHHNPNLLNFLSVSCSPARWRRP